MTIQKSATGQAGALADAAIAMVKGDKPNTTGTVKDGGRDVPSVLLDPVAIDKSNVKAVIDSGDMTAANRAPATTPSCALTPASAEGAVLRQSPGDPPDAVFAPPHLGPCTPWKAHHERISPLLEPRSRQELRCGSRPP